MTVTPFQHDILKTIYTSDTKSKPWSASEVLKQSIDLGGIPRTVGSAMKSLVKKGYMSLEARGNHKNPSYYKLTDFGKQFCDEKIK